MKYWKTNANFLCISYLKNAISLNLKLTKIVSTKKKNMKKISKVECGNAFFVSNIKKSMQETYQEINSWWKIYVLKEIKKHKTEFKIVKRKWEQQIQNHGQAQM